MKINIDKRKINISSNIKCVLSILVAFSFIITANAQMYLDQNYDLKAVKVISVLPIVINSSYGLESEVIANTLIEGMLKKKNLLVLPTQDISSNEANKLFNDSVANWDLINEIPVFTEPRWTLVFFIKTDQNFIFDSDVDPKISGGIYIRKSKEFIPNQVIGWIIGIKGYFLDSRAQKLIWINEKKIEKYEPTEKYLRKEIKDVLKSFPLY